MLSAAESNRTAVASARTRYARIPEVLPIPNLIELQLDSFKWFIENGLRELFDEISPIKDFTAKVMELQFLDYEFGPPKYSEEECRTKDLTFSRPLYVNVELLIKETGEIQRQRVYMGDYPWMTDQGTFVINGAERVVVSQLVRSPGVYYSELEDPASGRMLFSAKVMELQFLDYEFGDPKYSEEECRTKDLTFSKPLYVNVELLIKETGEIQRQRVYMGDYPWMT
ncbi:MAG TPA: hypothetical protein VK942_06930, partial [Actinomycetes bacterium]|nr:hypothetical protein [Actinomycetes bacterium]